MPELVLRGGVVIAGTGGPAFRADVAIEDGLITAVGDVGIGRGQVVDCTDRYVMPGFVDTHSHADATVFGEDTQLALLRQGVTTIITGQDGVSYAPGDGAYATEYFRALNGVHPTYRGGGVAELLASYDATTPVNVGYLVPHGTIRYEVMGAAQRLPNQAELGAMVELVQEGLTAGAVGLSTGLDYVPGRYASTDELVALCAPVASDRAVYVTHMRGGYETNAAEGMREVQAICVGAAVAAHVSHYHGPADLLQSLIDQMRAAGVDVTFDAYPYRAGYTLLAMPLLPPWLLALPPVEAAARIAEPTVRESVLREWMPSLSKRPYLGEGWAERMILGHVPVAEFQWAEGKTLAAAATVSGVSAEEFALDVLVAARLSVSAVMPLPPGRAVDELAALIRHSAHMVGSDGIYIGAHTHPRGWGSFARVLARHVSDRQDLSWPDAAIHLASRPAHRFGLAGRGTLRPGCAADIVVVDPARVAERASYANPRVLADGIDDVVVNGVLVLREGRLTGALTGRGIRRSVPAFEEAL